MSADTVEVQVKRVFLWKNGSVIFIGNEEKSSLFFTGPYEGALLKHALEGKRSERPLTHAAWLASLRQCGHPPERIVITRIVSGTFYADMTLDTDSCSAECTAAIIDCRPSDALTIAVLAKLPIHVAQDVWSKMKDHTDKLDLSDERLKETYPISNWVSPPTIYVGMTPEEIEAFEKEA